MATITFVSLEGNFINSFKQTIENHHELQSKNKYNYHCGKVQDYKPSGKVAFYISPANSLGFMDGGIDFAYSRIMFPTIERDVKDSFASYGKKTLLGRSYLPIGSAVIINTQTKDKYMISAPTMLLPQNVQHTQNAYWSTKAILEVLGNTVLHDEVEIVLTSMCCGYGKMSIESSVGQIIKALTDNYSKADLQTQKIKKVYIDEPNLDEQPLIYENTEWKKIEFQNIKHV
jgi:O-acetyl-ADP-ribose deacetylase (regulator of RNase III)